MFAWVFESETFDRIAHAMTNLVAGFAVARPYVRIAGVKSFE